MKVSKYNLIKFVLDSVPGDNKLANLIEYSNVADIVYYMYKNELVIVL